MGNLKTYNDFKQEMLNENIQLESNEQYQKIYQLVKESLESKDFNKIDAFLNNIKHEPEKNVNEGLLGAAVGATTAAAIGPAIMKAVCKALGISEGSALYNLLTSKLVLASISWTLFK